MSTNFDWSQYEAVEPSSQEKAFNWEEFPIEKQQPSRGRSLAGAFPKGLAKGVLDLVSMNPFSSVGPIPEKLQQQLIEKGLPTHEKGAEQLLERAGKLVPSVIGPGGLPLKVAQVAGGALSGQLAKEGDAGELGQGIAELVGLSAPGLLNKGAQKISQLIKAPKEKLSSGLTKPNVMDAKHAEKGIISPKRQEKEIKKLNQETAKLTQETIEKRLPKAKEIQEGRDFREELSSEFSDLQKSAEKANPEIDITDITDFLGKTKANYRGFPKDILPPDAQKIIKEVNSLRDFPQTQLKKLLKLYRFNNEKRSKIYETRFLTGKQKEYVDFLGDMNRAIAKSFERTLPKDSAWLEKFKSTNAKFAQGMQAEKVLDQLKTVLNAEPKPAVLNRLASDTKTQKKLELSMGKEGANEVIQIAKDRVDIEKSIRRIPAKELSFWDKVFPLAIFTSAGKALPIIKSAKYAQRAYGWYLTTPQRRKAYSQALEAIKNKDFAEYRKAADILNKEFKEGK